MVQIIAIVETEQSDWPGFMCRACFPLFKPYLQVRETHNYIYAVEMHPWQKFYRSWLEN